MWKITKRKVLMRLRLHCGHKWAGADGMRRFFFLFLSLLLPLTYMIYTADVFPALADEGYLWNNVLMTRDGLTSKLDFQGYDPLRYYFCVPFILAFGRGILSVRIAMAVIQVFSIYTLLNYLNKHKIGELRGIAAFFIAASMQFWYVFYHKTIDISMPIYTMCLLTWFFQSKRDCRFFFCGVYAGFCVLAGRNHAVYALAAFSIGYLIVLLCGERMRAVKRVLLAGIGILVGFSPSCLMFLLIPGYFTAYLSDVFATFLKASTGDVNLPLPITWIWSIEWSNLSFPLDFAQVATGMFFTLVPVFFIGTMVLLIWKRRRALCTAPGPLACVVVGLIYLHYAFSRADIGHIAHSIVPVIALIVLLVPCLKKKGSFFSQTVGVVASVLIFAYSALGTVTSSKAYAKFVGSYPYIVTTADGSAMVADKYTAEFVRTVQDIISEMRVTGREALFTPYIPGMYAVVGLQSPVYTTYFLFPTTNEKQEEMVCNIKESGTLLVIMSNAPIDGREELLMQNAYPLLYTYITEHFEEVENALPQPYILYQSVD